MWRHLSFWLAPLSIAGILAVLALPLLNRTYRRIYSHHFRESRRERLFVAATAFAVALIVVRTVTELIHHQIGPFHDVSMRGRHIHHLVWGILTLLFVGYLWVLELGTGSSEGWVWAGRFTSALYGAGAALTLDEFALWLNLKDVYWERQGRASFEAMAIFGALLVIGLIAGRFFGALARSIFKRDTS